MSDHFIGVKIISATPMTRLEYNNYRGWEVPADERPDDEGYMVEYADSEPNHPNHLGYISWSPKDQFDKCHVLIPNVVKGDPPFLLRLKAERAELNDRLSKLTAFLDRQPVRIDETQHQLMNQQRKLMKKLRDVLDARLELLQ